MSQDTAYILGSDDLELARIDQQANAIAGPTEMLLRAARIGGSMRVLDVGTGMGHVAMQVAGLLGPDGSVLGIDQSERMVEIAETRRAAAGVENVTFRQADARTFSASEPFDAIIARLLLQHLPDREEFLRSQMELLRPGGILVVIEYDTGAVRSEPQVPLVASLRDMAESVLRAGGADSRIGVRAGQLLRYAGFLDVSTLGIQTYHPSTDAIAVDRSTAMIRVLAPQIVALGLADEAELGLETLESRIRDQLAASDAILMMPTVIGAWGTRPATTP